MYDIAVSADQHAAPPGEPAQCGHGGGIRSQEQRPGFLGGIVRFKNESYIQMDIWVVAMAMAIEVA